MSNTVDSAIPPATLALASLAAFIAANHPKKGLCQLDILRNLNVPQAHVDLIVDIARHLRDEAGQIIDSEFNAAFASATKAVEPATASADSCCTATTKGNACC
jgi:uncharacterized BrkB/YihY/UPF0761 family membrane protein